MRVEVLKRDRFDRCVVAIKNIAWGISLATYFDESSPVRAPQIGTRKSLVSWKNGCRLLHYVDCSN